MLNQPYCYLSFVCKIIVSVLFLQAQCQFMEEKNDDAVKEDEECFPESFYGVAKLASEHYLRIYQQYGIEATNLRLFNVYGKGQNLDNLKQGMVSIYLAQMIRDKHIHIKGSPDRFRDFIHVDDVIEAL